MPTQEVRNRIRSNFEQTLPDTAAVYRTGTPTVNADLGDDPSFTLLESYSAAHWSLTGQEALVLQRLDVRASVMVELPATADVTERDQIVYTEAESGQVHHYEVSFVSFGTRRFLRRVACIEYKF